MHMNSYKATFIDLSYQTRQVITLIRQNNKTNVIECLRVSSDKIDYRNEVAKRINYFVTTDARVLSENYAGHHGACENILGATLVQNNDQEGLWEEVMGLLQCHYEPSFHKTFMEHEVNRNGGLFGSCSNLVLENCGGSIINDLIDKASEIVPQGQPVYTSL